MIRVKKPIAIVYGWKELGDFELISDVYFEENLEDSVLIYSLEDVTNIEKDFSFYRPDVVVVINQNLPTDKEQILSKSFYYNEIPVDNILANDIVCQSTFINSRNRTPFFSIFTPAYMTGERLIRTYESLQNQTFNDWEWIVVDDSPNEKTWNILQELSHKDFRVKPYKVLPITGGNVGLAKKRACGLATGKWLVELDHDDYLLSPCLQECYNASLKFPDAGFMYSDVCELYEDGQMRNYDHDFSGNWYAREDNFFDFGYAGHTWVEVDGKQYLTHHYPDINPLTIRFNVSMPNHVRVWKKELYDKIGGHSEFFPVADDYELIVRTFLTTRMVHIKKLLYLQYNNGESTVDKNRVDINRRARLIRDYYNKQIHHRIEELGFFDWNWDVHTETSQKFQNGITHRRFYDDEQVLNYTYE